MTTDAWRLLGTIAVTTLLWSMVLTTWLPFAPKRAGTVLLEVPLRYPQRVLVHRRRTMWLLLLILIGSLPGGGDTVFVPGTPVIAFAGLAVVMMLPLRYVFTDRGVALNNGVAQPYRLFRRFDVRPGRRSFLSPFLPLEENVTVILRGKQSGDRRRLEPRYALYLPKGRHDEVVRLLKRHIR